MSNEPETRTVNAPMGFCNRELNGSVVLILSQNENCAQTLILTGREAGREWQFNPSHLSPNSYSTER